MTEYQRTRQPYSDLLSTSDQERFWSKVEKSADCWTWTASCDSSGYGIFGVNRRTSKAHRVAWELQNKQRVPLGLTLDHVCRNIRCVRPSHLEPVSNKENILRGTNFSAELARRTHCKRGHEFTPENTLVRTDSDGTHRKCRTCVNAKRRKNWGVPACPTCQRPFADPNPPPVLPASAQLSEARCDDCQAPLNAGEAACFTVCDACWDKHYHPASAGDPQTEQETSLAHEIRGMATAAAMAGNLTLADVFSRWANRAGELESAASPPAWQGIETCPKNEHVLLWSPAIDDSESGHWEGDMWVGKLKTAFGATRWTRLPAPPRSEAG